MSSSAAGEQSVFPTGRPRRVFRSHTRALGPFSYPTDHHFRSVQRIDLVRFLNIALKDSTPIGKPFCPCDPWNS